MARAFVRASSQYLTRTSAILNSPPLTVAGWGYSDDAANQQHLFSIRDKSATATLLFLAFGGNIAGDPVRLDVRDSALNRLTPDTSTGYSTNTWHHLAGVWAATNDARVFIDGGSKVTDTAASVNNLTLADRTSIGASDTTVIGSPMSGNIAEVGLWNATLTDAEIAILATGVSPLAVRPQSLVAYWPLMGNLSPEIDIVGGYDLTLTNVPTKAAHPAVFYPVPPMIHHVPTAGIAALNVNISKSADYIQVVTP